MHTTDASLHLAHALRLATVPTCHTHAGPRSSDSADTGDIVSNIGNGHVQQQPRPALATDASLANNASSIGGLELAGSATLAGKIALAMQRRQMRRETEVSAQLKHYVIYTIGICYLAYLRGI